MLLPNPWILVGILRESIIKRLFINLKWLIFLMVSHQNSAFSVNNEHVLSFFVLKRYSLRKRTRYTASHYVHLNLKAKVLFYVDML